MESALIPALILLSIVWFLVYWVFGGVLFAVVTLVRFQQLKRVQFSCLFSILSLVIAVAAAYIGLRMGEGSIETCVADADTHAAAISAIFGCGFVAVIGSFLLGGAALVVFGVVLMALSQGKADPWIRFNVHGDEALEQEGVSIDNPPSTPYTPPHNQDD